MKKQFTTLFAIIIFNALTSQTTPQRIWSLSFDNSLLTYRYQYKDMGNFFNVHAESFYTFHSDFDPAKPGNRQYFERSSADSPYTKKGEGLVLVDDALERYQQNSLTLSRQVYKKGFVELSHGLGLNYSFVRSRIGALWENAYFTKDTAFPGNYEYDSAIEIRTYHYANRIGTHYQAQFGIRKGRVFLGLFSRINLYIPLKDVTLLECNPYKIKTRTWNENPLSFFTEIQGAYAADRPLHGNETVEMKRVRTLQYALNLSIRLELFLGKKEELSVFLCGGGIVMNKFMASNQPKLNHRGCFTLGINYLFR